MSEVNNKKIDVAIIGAGPVGIFASFQAGMLGMSSCIIDSLNKAGGQCQELYPHKPIYDIPAYANISGQNLIEQLIKQASPFNPQYLLGQTVNKLKILPQTDKNNQIFVLETDKQEKIEAKTVIIAAGAGCFGPNRPPIPNLRQYEESSVFYSVQSPEQFANKKVVIAGGGDSALDWAIELSKITSKLYLVHRRDKFRANASSVAKIHELAKKNQLELVTNYQLTDIEGENGNIKNIVVSTLSGEERKLEADILLPFFGLNQNLGPILDFGLNINQHNIDVNPTYYETNIEGIYAVGDVANYLGKLKLILCGFSEASIALHHAYKRVFDGKMLHFEYSTSKGIKT